MHPQELYFDPSVDNYKDGEVIFIERSINVEKLRSNPDFKEGVELFLKRIAISLMIKLFLTALVDGKIEKHKTTVLFL